MGSEWLFSQFLSVSLSLEGDLGDIYKLDAKYRCVECVFIIEEVGGDMA